MSDLQFHPLSNMFPLMEGAEFEALVADILARGLREKIDLYQGKIVDGRNRYRALQYLGIEPNDNYFRKAIYTHSIGGEIAPHEENNDDRVRTYVISKNIHRRHLTAEQRRGLIAELLKAQPEKSDRQIALTVKASPTTVGSVRSEMEVNGDVSKLDTRTDTNGRQQPAKKKRKPGINYMLDNHHGGKVSKAQFEARGESDQESIYDDACLFVENMTAATRQTFFAHLREKYELWAPRTMFDFDA